MQALLSWVQSGSLYLTTTSAEEIALGVKLWLASLRLVRAFVDEACMTLLLLLHIMTVEQASPMFSTFSLPCCLQSASLCLTTTPAEEMALGLKFWLAPFRLVRAPVDEICMTLLLSLRFMSVVFDELRNLSLGLAARSVPWKQLPPGAGLQV